MTVPAVPHIVQHRAYFYFLCLLYSTTLTANNLELIISTTAKPENNTYAYTQTMVEDASPILSNALQSMPAPYVQTLGSPGQLTTVSFRGLSASNTIAYMDDIPLNSSASGMFDFAHLLSGSFDKVITTPNPSPVLYGPGATGGIVLLNTGKNTNQIKAEVGSFDSLYAYGRKSTYLSDNGTLSLHGESLYTSGLPQYGPSRTLGEKAPYTNQTAAIRHDYYKGRNTTVKTTLRATQDFGKYDESIYNLGPKPQGRQTTQMVLGSVKAIHKKSVDVCHTLIAFSNYNRAHFSQESRSQHLISGAKYTWQHQWNTQQQTLLLTNLHHTSLKTHVLSKKRTEGGMGVLHKSHLVQNFFSSFGVRNDYAADFKNLLTYEVTLGHERPHRTLTTSFKTGAKPPQLYDVYMDNFFVRANPTLKPESTKTIDFTLRQQFSQNYHMQAALYHTIAHRLIVGQFNNGKQTTINAPGNSQISGAEIAMYLHIFPNWQCKPFFTYTRMYYKNRQDAPSFPNNKAGITVEHHLSEQWHLNADFLFIGSRISQSHTLPSVQLFDVGIAYFLTRDKKFYVKANNVTNAHYQYIYGYRTPGRSLYAGLHFYF